MTLGDPMVLVVELAAAIELDFLLKRATVRPAPAPAATASKSHFFLPEPLLLLEEMATAGVSSGTFAIAPDFVETISTFGVRGGAGGRP